MRTNLPPGGWPRLHGVLLNLPIRLNPSRSSCMAIVGSTTAGADGNVSGFALPGGLRTMISGIGVFYPDKKPTQRIGIIPDVEVRPTITGIRAGRDEVLEVALRQILEPAAARVLIEKVLKR